VELVGRQVWRGAFLLADFLLANRHHFKVEIYKEKSYY
jgi:hypothetical protein